MSFISNCRFTSPGAARHGLRQSEEPCGLALHTHGNEQCRPYLQFREALRLRHLLFAGSARVTQLRQAQVIESALQPRESVERRASADLQDGIAQRRCVRAAPLR